MNDILMNDSNFRQMLFSNGARLLEFRQRKKTSMEFNNIVNGQLFEKKQKIEKMTNKQEREICIAQFIEIVFSLFQAVAFSCEKLVINERFIKTNSLTDDLIKNMMLKKGVNLNQINHITPLKNIISLVGILNDDDGYLIQSEPHSLITLNVYLAIGILKSEINNSIKEELKKIGFLEEDLIWLMPYEQILLEAQMINLGGKFMINLIELEIVLKCFVELSITKTVVNRLSPELQKDNHKLKTPFLKKQIENIEDHFNYVKKNELEPSKKIQYKIFSVIKKHVEPHLDEIPQKKLSTFEQYSKYVLSDNFDSILTSIYTHHTIDVIPCENEAEKYRTFYKLFSLMMPHRNWDISPGYLKIQKQEMTEIIRKFITKK